MDGPLATSQFYRGKSIFITGVTGFIGKVLLEKILRSFPDVAGVFVLIRSRKGLAARERLDSQVTRRASDATALRH